MAESSEHPRENHKVTGLERPGLSLCVRAARVGDSPTVPWHCARLGAAQGAGSPRAGPVPLVPGPACPPREASKVSLKVEKCAPAGEPALRHRGEAAPGRAGGGRAGIWAAALGFYFIYFFKN